MLFGANTTNSNKIKQCLEMYCALFTIFNLLESNDFYQQISNTILKLTRAYILLLKATKSK